MQTTVRIYKEWRSLAHNWATSKDTTFLGVYGNPGLSKTFTLRQVLGEKARVIRCHGTPLQLYRALYDIKDTQHPALLDDVDSMLKELKVLNMLKGAFDTPPVIQWNSTRMPKNEDGIELPMEFEFKANRIAVISNDPKIFDKHLRAVEDRGLVVHLEPDSHEVHLDVGEWWMKIKTDNGVPAFDKEVYEYMSTILDQIAFPTQRAYIQSARLKRSGIDWRKVIQDTFCLHPDQQAVRQLMVDNSYSSEERVAEFARKTSRSRATYFRYQEEVTRSTGLVPVPVDYQARDNRLRLAAEAEKARLKVQKK